tara:strand:+ start:164 stop:541 length:378 start_codon:yes stop_codon:yes gene_type:complete
MIENNEQYISLSTQKTDGSFVRTPVWFAREGIKQNYFVYTAKRSGKVKRIKNFSHVKVAVCNFRGKINGDWIEAKAYLIEDEILVKLAFSLLRKKYGIKFFIGDFLSWIVGKYNQRQIINIQIKN